jgi:hypothetical protein
LLRAVISGTRSVSGMTTPAMLSAAVVDMCNSWNQRLIGLCAPSFGSRHGENSGAAAVALDTPRVCALRADPRCDHELPSLAIVTAAIGDVATAAMQPTYLLAAICRGDWVSWTRQGRQDCARDQGPGDHGIRGRLNSRISLRRRPIGVGDPSAVPQPLPTRGVPVITG